MPVTRRLKVQLALIPMLIGAVSMFLVFTASLVWIYQDDIFQTIQDPRQPFQTYEPPEAPDYHIAESWLSLPDLSIDPYTLDEPGDVFVVVPSVYRGGEHYVLPSDDLRRKSKLERIVRPNYVTPYGEAGRLFAPFYRQASLYSYMTTREDARLAQDFAYQDVKRAFDEFLTMSPPERPLVLVGHNQGAAHLIRILQDFFYEGSPLNERLAVAYVIDYPVPLDLFEGSLSALRPCEMAEDIKCVAAFGTFMPGENVIADRFTDRLLVHDGQSYESVFGRPLLCINPLTWLQNEDYAPERLHLGGVAAEGLEPDIRPAASPNEVGAQCEGGILRVDRPKSRSLRRPIQVGAKFRTLPSNLFYEDLKQNAITRVMTLLDSGALPVRAQRLDDFDVVDVEESPVTPAQDRPPTSRFPDQDKR